MINLIGVILALAIVIFLIRKRYNFGLSLILGSIVVAIFSLFTVSYVDICKAFSKAVIYDFDENKFDLETVELAVLLTLIYMLAKTMQKTGAINKMVESFRTMFLRGGTIGIIPAIYGLMPVPGGALFSAPLVEEEGGKFKLKQDQKNFLNVWWRHIWFPIYPISSAMLLVVSEKFSNIGIYDLILADLPAFFVFIIIGLICLRLFVKPENVEDKGSKKDYSNLVFLIPPIVPVITYVIIFVILSLIGIENPDKFQRVAFIVGVALSFFVLYFQLKINYNEYIKAIKSSISYNMALAIFGIMVFREMIEISRINEIITNAMINLSFPPLLIIILIPIILGLLTGYNLAAIALSYSLIQPFFGFTGLNIVGVTSIIFICSLIGYLISPIHLCNVVSSEYLKTDVTKLYKMYIPSVFVLLSIQTIFISIFYVK